MNNIEIIDLQVFCCVARLSSFVAAAQELGISPAYVSKRIAELERRFGVTLFHRTTRRVRISAQGEVAYAWAFGDGATSDEQSPSHTYISAGTYTWTLTVTSGEAMRSRVFS